jgi:plasmid maintenance system antidote protein VapI
MANVNKHKKELAEKYFLQDNMTAKDIATRLEVNEGTVGEWRKKGDWDLRKTVLTTSPILLKELVLKQMEIVANGGKSTINADGLLKMQKVYEAFSETTNPQVVSSVFMEYDLWLAEHNPAFAAQSTSYHQQFLLHKINMEG